MREGSGRVAEGALVLAMVGEMDGPRLSLTFIIRASCSTIHLSCCYVIYVASDMKVTPASGSTL